MVKVRDGEPANDHGLHELWNIGSGLLYLKFIR